MHPDAVERLSAAYKLTRSEATENETHEFLFHLRDCADDLEQFVAVLQHPHRFSDAETKRVVDGLLLHAAGHIVQAARLYGGFIDTFGSTGEEPPGDQ